MPANDDRLAHQIDIDKAIRIATAEVKDPYAQTYLRAMSKAIEFGQEGFQTQLLYALSNMRSWRGELARQVKASIKNYLSLSG